MFPMQNLARKELTHWGLDKMAAFLLMTFFKCILLNENPDILIQMSLKFVCKVPLGMWLLFTMLGLNCVCKIYPGVTICVISYV